MDFKKCVKEAFSVVGKEGSSESGEGFISELWDAANADFDEVLPLAKKDRKGNPAIWGMMSDLSRSFKPWEDDFSKGLYLAGVEVNNTAKAPLGWVKWTIPSFEYICVKVEDNESFNKAMAYLKENNIPLAGAIHEHISTEENESYMYFPIRKL